MAFEARNAFLILTQRFLGFTCLLAIYLGQWEDERKTTYFQNNSASFVFDGVGVDFGVQYTSITTPIMTIMHYYP